MSQIYELREGDDIREIKITLVGAPSAPTEALMIITRGEVRIERDLALSGGKWRYRFEDADFEDLIGSPSGVTYKLEVYATFSDGTNGTYPTRPGGQVKVFSRS